MPREFSEGSERRRRNEIDESKEDNEARETPRGEKEVEESSERPTKEEGLRESAEKAINEMNEVEEPPEEIRESVREAIKDLEGIEKELGHSIDEVREELHEDFVNDMEAQLKDASVKETPSDSEEGKDEGETKEYSASGESYVDGGDGTVYSMEIREDAESSSEVEIKESPEQELENSSETHEVQEESEEVPDKVRNTITKPEVSENEVHEETPEESYESKREQTRLDKYQSESTETNESPEPSKEHIPVKEQHEVERPSEIDENRTSETESEESREARSHDIEVPDEYVDDVREMHEAQGEDFESPESLPIDIEDETSEETESVIEDIEIPEDVEKSIEELAEDIVKELEAQEEEEVEADTPYIIVDAMTGQEYIDHTYEYRPSYQETEEETSEQEGVKVQERVDDAFAELPEEEREKIKEKVHSKLETEEDLEELLEQHPSNRASPDFDEKYEEAKEYIRRGQKGDAPRLVKELLKDEVRRVWTNYVLSNLQRIVKQHSPKKPGLNSEKERQLYLIHRLHAENNISDREIAKKLGISRNQVRTALRDYEIHERYYGRKETLARISSELNLSIYALRNLFRKYEWQLQIQTKRSISSNSEIKKLHLEEGLTFIQISLRTGLSLEKIRKIVVTQKGTTTEEEIHRLYFQEGLSFDQVSSELRISMKTIRRAFRRHKWKFRKATTTKQLDEQWVYHLYYVEGFSTHEIANILGVHSATVQKLFHEQQWIPRSKIKPRPKEDIDLKRREYQKSRRHKLKETRIQMFGITCYACNSQKKTKKNLHLHRKDGKEHSRHLFRSQKKLESLKVDEWAPLCDRCHLGVTLLMKSWGYDWDDIESFLSERDDTSKPSKEYLELSEEDVPISRDFQGSADDLRKHLFGNSCSLCGKYDESLILHRKDGKTHDPQLVRSKKHLQKLRPKEWAHVCGDCHNITHWALEKLGISWLKLTRILKSKK